MKPEKYNLKISPPRNRIIGRMGFLLLFHILLLTFTGIPSSDQIALAHLVQPAPVQNGQEVIQLVNQLRASRGLPAFQVDAALMTAAQSHSEYQASIGSTTHTGPGGSSVTSRAIAAGYGGGASVSVVENVYGGGGGTPQQAVNWWQNDSLHLATLISTHHTDVGAGASGGYYTLVVGAVTGAPGSAATQIAWGEQATSQVAAPGGATANVASPAAPIAGSVLIATPGPDGSIIHEVQPGETVWSIAASYDVSLAEILRINGLNANSSVIVPGQKIIIQPAGTLPTATFALTNMEGTPVAALTDQAQPATLEAREPAQTPLASSTVAVLEVAAISSPNAVDAGELPFGLSRKAGGGGLDVDPILLLIIGLVLVGGGLLVVGKLLHYVSRP